MALLPRGPPVRLLFLSALRGRWETACSRRFILQRNILMRPSSSLCRDYDTHSDLSVHLSPSDRTIRSYLSNNTPILSSPHVSIVRLPAFCDCENTLLHMEANTRHPQITRLLDTFVTEAELALYSRDSDRTRLVRNCCPTVLNSDSIVSVNPSSSAVATWQYHNPLFPLSASSFPMSAHWLPLQSLPLTLLPQR